MESGERAKRFTLAVTFLPLCWWLMLACHELGHVCGAWLVAARVNQIVLHPLAIPRTDIAPNANPLLIVWCGPLCGVIFPLCVWRLSVFFAPGFDFLARFFFGFCLIANGLYISIGSVDRIGDAGSMLDYGSPGWLLWLFGALAVPSGFLVWNGQGSNFGLGPAPFRIEGKVVLLSTCLLAITLLLMLMFGS